MTRSEAYEEGFHEGRRWAEEDIRNHARDPEWDRRTDGQPDWGYGGITRDAYRIGNVRGYRDTWARWDAGTLTASMLEHAPLRAGR